MRKTKSDTAFSDEVIESTVRKPRFDILIVNKFPYVKIFVTNTYSLFSVFNTLPFQICYGIKVLVVFLFKFTIQTINNWNKESPVKPSKEQIRQR